MLLEKIHSISLLYRSLPTKHKLSEIKKRTSNKMQQTKLKNDQDKQER